MVQERKKKLTSQWVKAGGWQIYTRIAAPMNGGQEPLVLVHGLGVSSRYMVRLLNVLGDSRPVYVLDLPGFGKSQKPPEVLDIPALAHVLVDWMDALQLRKVSFLGNSFGCQIIVELAQLYPERLSKAVLQGPTVDLYTRTSYQQISWLLFDGLLEPPSLLPIVAYDYLRAGIGRVLQTLWYMLEDPVEQKLPLVKVPVLVVRGAYDPVVSQKWCEQMAHLLPLGELKVVPGSAHAVNYSSPQQLAAVVELFLAKEF